MWLEIPFEENKVYKVVRKMAKDKAAGLDGFTIAFFQTVGCGKGGIIKVFLEFYNGSSRKASMPPILC